MFPFPIYSKTNRIQNTGKIALPKYVEFVQNTFSGKEVLNRFTKSVNDQIKIDANKSIRYVFTRDFFRFKSRPINIVGTRQLNNNGI
jgi:hypothetical protein